MFEQYNRVESWRLVVSSYETKRILMHVDVWYRFIKWFHPVYIGKESIADVILFRQLKNDPHLSNTHSTKRVKVFY